MLTGKYDQAISSILLIAKVCIQISICLGVIVTIIYCGSIGFYPSGLTIGDTLFFIAASLAFAVSYTLVVLAILAAGITISPFLRRLQLGVISIFNIYRRHRKKEEIKSKINFPKIGPENYATLFVGLFFIILVLSMYSKDFDQAFSLTLATLSMSFCYGAWYTKPANPKNKENWEKKVKIGLVIFAYFLPFFIIQARGNFFNQSMRMIGVRTENCIIQLSKKHTDFLDSNNISCSSKSKEGEGVYNNVVILFRGIGNSVVIKVKDISVAVPSKDIIIGYIKPKPN